MGLSSQKRSFLSLAGRPWPALPIVAAALLWLCLLPSSAHADGPFAEVWLDDAVGRTQSVAWGDMDGDGDLDLAVGNNGQVNRLYRNEGPSAGSGWAFTELPGALGTTAYNTTSVAWGDMDGDGDLDLAVGNARGWIDNPPRYADGGVRLYRNEGPSPGSGWVFTELLLGPADDYTQSLAWGDMDGDGDLDLAVGNEEQVNRLYRNDGPSAGSGWAFTELLGALGTIADDTRSVAWGDMDGDGDLDLAVGNHGQVNRLYRNEGGGSFTELLGALGTTTYNTTSLAWGDMDGDGDLDLAVGNREWNGPPWVDGGVRLYRNEGPSTGSGWVFTELPGVLGTTAYNNNITSVAWGDMDGDGDLDLAFGNYGEVGPGGSDWIGGGAHLYRNEGGGGFVEVPGALVNTFDYTVSVAWGDMDGDGDLDLVIGNDWQVNRLYRNEGGGVLTLAWVAPVTDSTRSVAWGDMDGDGDLDLAVGNDGQVNRLYRNDGGGVFAELSGALGTTAYNAASLAWGDLDGDGDLDLAVGNARDWHDRPPGCAGDGGGVRVYRNEGPSPGSGWVFTELPDRLGTASDCALSVAWGDYDGDGDLDLAVGNAGNGQVNRLYRNEGGGVFAELSGALGTTAYNTASLAWGDLDGDGDLDLAVGNWGRVNHLYRNEGGGVFAELSGVVGTTAHWTKSVAWGDMDGDGDLDLAVGNDGQVKPLYRNEGGGVFAEACTLGTVADRTYSLAWGDMDGDGDLDLAVGNNWQANRLYENTQQGGKTLPDNAPAIGVRQPASLPAANFYAISGTLTSQTIPITYTLFDPEGDPLGQVETFYSLAGGGQWYTATAASGTVATDLAAGRLVRAACAYSPALVIPDGTGVPLISTLAVSAAGTIADLDVSLTISHTRDSDLQAALVSPAGTVVTLFDGMGGDGDNFLGTVLDDQAATPITSGTAPFTGTHRPQGSLAQFNSQPLAGTWRLVITDTAGSETGFLIGWGLRLTTPPASHVYAWDTFASGFFGQSDNVVVRMLAYPQPPTGTITGTYHYLNAAAGPYQRPWVSATTFPFRVRGTQVQVLSGTQAISNALVYRLPAGQTAGGFALGTTITRPFVTDANGYLTGHGRLGLGDRLLALASVPLPPTYTERYSDSVHLYYTNGTPIETGLNAYTVTQPGVQQLVVSPDHPLLLFDLEVALEWDAHNDPLYLQQLATDLQRASAFLYDFTDGQAALGHITVHQNGDEWLTSDVVVYATNRLRPLAVMGGAVLTPTVDPGHADIVYDTGQVRMGAVWNRYGDPVEDTHLDWQLALAHELAHYLLFQEDTYLGLNPDGLLIPLRTCAGSAMGDVYDDRNTEFLDDSAWDERCAATLTQATLGRSEWATVEAWYPGLRGPGLRGADQTDANPGPSTMPFELTTVSILDPVTPTETLADPTFYVDYLDGATGSSAARAFLLRQGAGGQYVQDLGNPVSGQDRVLARGARPGDRLCVFDQPRGQYGCKSIQTNDTYHLTMHRGESWTPLVQVSPVTSQTIAVAVGGLSPTLTLQARLYPEYGYGSAPITLTHSSDVYSGTFADLPYPAVVGHVQVFSDTSQDTWQQTVVAFVIGGNPGQDPAWRGPFDRGSGPFDRGSGPFDRGSGPFDRGSGAFAVSPDGQMSLFTPSPDFAAGDMYTIQAMSSLPPLPPGKLALGAGYRLVSSAAPLTSAATVSFQYLGLDALRERVDEEGLIIHFWDGATWRALDSVVDSYANMASARCQGDGVYALLSGQTMPAISTVTPAAATNELTTTLVISGSHFLAPVEVALIGSTASYSLPVVAVSPLSVTAVVSAGLPAREYQVIVYNRLDGTASNPAPFALYSTAPADTCFYDFFESGAGKWQRSGEWDIVTIVPSGQRAMTDSPLGSYRSAGDYGIGIVTYTTAITSQPFDLGGCPNAILTFRHDYALARLDASQDVARVEISTDDGAIWSTLASFTGGGVFGVAGQDVESPEWAGVDWKSVMISLSAYTGTVRLRFSLEVDQDLSYKGWLLDDVLVRRPPSAFLPVILKP